MLSSIFKAIYGIFSAIGNLFGFLKKRQELENSPVMEQNKQNIQVQTEKDKVNIDLQNNDITELGKDIAD